MEQLIILLLFGAAAAFQSWQQKRQKDAEEAPDEDWTPTTPRSTPPPVPGESATGSSDWEAELRRLLEGNEPVSRPKPPTPPPLTPPVVPLPRQVQPKPKPTLTPRKPIPQPVELREGPRTLTLAKMTASTAAQDRVAQMQKRVSERLTQVSATHLHFYKAACSKCGGKIEFPANAAGSTVNCPHCQRPTKLAVLGSDAHLLLPGAPAKRRSPEAKAALGLLTSRHGLRQAMIASIILGPPKALEK